MSRPAGMPYAAHALGDIIADLFLQVCNPALRLDDIYMAALKDSHSCRIITSVFQLFQTVKKNLSRIVFAYVSYDTTHIVYLQLITE